MMTRLSWDGKVPVICARTKDPAAHDHVPAAGYEESRMLGEIETKWKTHRGHAKPLGLWTPAPEKLGCWVTPEEGRSWALLDPDLDNLRRGWKLRLCEKLCTS